MTRPGTRKTSDLEARAVRAARDAGLQAFRVVVSYTPDGGARVEIIAGDEADTRKSAKVDWS